MGCNTSRLDRLPAVALCRDRCKFVDEALRQSYALADAHVAHMESLKTLGPALLCFFQGFEDSDETNVAIKETKVPLAKSPSSLSSSSDSDAHVLLHSESEPEEDAEKEEYQVSFTHARYDYAHAHVISPPRSGGYSGSKPPPSPPPPTSGSAWDFLNFFEPYEKYHVAYFPSGGDADVAEKEKEKVQKHEESKSKEDKQVEKNEKKCDSSDSKEKKVVVEKEEVVTEQCGDSAKGFSDAMKQIQILFEKASESGNAVLEMLDVGKLRYHRKFDFNSVSCKMMHVFSASAHSSPVGVNCMESSLLGRRMESDFEGVSRDKGVSYSNLCSTLKKLCMWEKKLYHEVKVEEKLRILHQKKCKQLRRMKQKDADAQKIDAVQSFIGILATKMKISIQVVDKISITISNLREEELWPQIERFILMFLGMWKDMQECYKCQYQEIVEAKVLVASSLNRKSGNAHIDATIKLKSEVQKWNLSFLDWIHAQKSQVKALNGWLVRCLLYEPEEVPDDSTPFCPSKIGAPPVFVICNKWSKAVDNLSEKNVIEAVNGFMLRLNELLEKHILDLQQKLALDNELERKVKMLERQEQKMHKVVKKMVPVGREESDALLRGDVVHHADIYDTTNLQSGLKQIFGAMEKFTDTTARLYEELCQQINQDNHILGESN